jgi:hypothetical protein
MTRAMKESTDAQNHNDVFQQMCRDTRVDETPASSLFWEPVFICFPEQEGARSMPEAKALMNGPREEYWTSCDGEGCQAVAQQVDGWLFVGSDGEQRHYCRRCLVSYLEGLREQTTPEMKYRSA